MCVFQIKLMGQLYTQVSSAHVNTMLWHFSLDKFSRVKTTIHLTPRVSLSFSQKSCSGPKRRKGRLAFATRSKRSPGAKQFETEPSGVGQGYPARLPGTDVSSVPGLQAGRNVAGYSGTLTRTSPTPSWRRSIICPARAEHTPLLKPRSVPPQRSPRGNYLTDPLLGRALA